MPFGLVLLEPVRSADPPIISGTATVRVSSAVSDAARVAVSFGVAASFSFAERTAAASSSVAGLAGVAPQRKDIRGNDEGGLRPAQSFARAFDLVGAEGRAVALLGAGLAGSAKADGGAAGDQRRPRGGLRRGDGLGDRFGVM